MLAQVDITWEGRERLIALHKEGNEALMTLVATVLGDRMPKPEDRGASYNWNISDLVLDESEMAILTNDCGIHFETKKIKGTLLREMRLPDPHGTVQNTYVQVPHVGLLTINEVMLMQDCCTDLLQAQLNDGWRLLCVCPPNAARRPDYILGRTK